MLVIKNIGQLIGHKFTQLHTERNWEVADIGFDTDFPNTYSIHLGKYSPLLYDPITFNATRKLLESKTLILKREQVNGTYALYDGKDSVRSHLALDISLMDTKEKLIAAIEFIL